MSAPCRRAILLTAALLLHASLACAANTYVLSVKELQPRILSLGKTSNSFSKTTLSTTRSQHSSGTLYVQWHDPLPVTVTSVLRLSLAIGCSVQRAGSGFIQASILTETTGLANWHIIHQGDAAAGRATSGKLFLGSDVSKYDPCKYGDAKPTVLIDVILSDGGSTRALLARYIYQGR